jgi:2-oxoglutarate dehydrogenase E1 component
MSTGPGFDLNPEQLEALYRQWQKKPDSVDRSWQLFFVGFDLARSTPVAEATEAAHDQSRIASLIYSYRQQGHRLARCNPLTNPPAQIPDLALETFGLTEKDLDREFDTGHLPGPRRAPLREILKALTETYCGSIGVEYVHIQDLAIRRWLQDRMEPDRNRPQLTREQRLRILETVVDAELLEAFIQSRYLGQKRFSLEGAETLVPLVHWIVDVAPELGVEEFVIGMAHRGRLNLLANLFDMPYSAIFAQFEDNLPETVSGSGDVKYHQGFSSVHRSHRDGRPVRLCLTANPSHLEAIDPVVLGQTRARQRQVEDADGRRKVVPLLIHGDAAFAGQGIVAETLNLARLKGYWVGGTIHVIVNNQIGFTAGPEEVRSSLYASDLARSVEAPVFHVNGDDPEAAAYVGELALRFRQQFARDVVIDLLCYRRHGHSEVDDPSFTQPRLYRNIRQHTAVRKLYVQQLVRRGDLPPGAEQELAGRFEARLEEALQRARSSHPEPAEEPVVEVWKDLLAPYSDQPVETGVPHERLVEIAKALTTVPEGFHLNPKIARLLPPRGEAVQRRGNADWALCEALAWGSLLMEGAPVRLSGQDSARGTFSQRHALWVDAENEARYVPLNHLAPNQAAFCVYNSPLSEASVLGFDYGYSLAEPRMLIQWEAQFGDFANGAQVMLDQFVMSAQSRWNRHSGIVLLLPHGYEGQGPDHSSAFVERCLAACAEENAQVCNPSTPAQYFHLLRRQMKRPFRRPLIVFTPKSLLRHPRCVSPVAELVAGRFAEVLDDPAPPPSPRRVALCTGKIFYELLEAREKQSAAPVALLRVEQLYPFPEALLRQALERYPSAEELIWVQEEPANRGAWSFIEPRLRRIFPSRPPRYVGRRAAASAATGSLRKHREEQAAILRQALCATCAAGDVHI